MLTGKPIKDYDFLTRAFNMISPISINLEESDGRDFLFNSGYDLRMTTYYAPDGTNLTDNPEIRSMFQQAIGKYNLEYELNKLAKDPKIIASMQLMYSDIRAGRRGDFNARDYYHNQVIDQLFKKIRKSAWRDIMYVSEVSILIAEQKAKKAQQNEKSIESSYSLLTMYK